MRVRQARGAAGEQRLAAVREELEPVRPARIGGREDGREAPVAAEDAHPVATPAPEAGGLAQDLLPVPGEAEADAVAARHLLALAGVAASRRDDLPRFPSHPEMVGRLLELGLQRALGPRELRVGSVA